MIFAFLLHSHHHGTQSWTEALLEIVASLAIFPILVLALWVVRRLEKIANRHRRRKMDRERRKNDATNPNPNP
jgi:hypothetical protein